MSFSIIKAETRLANMVIWISGIQKKITDFVVGGKTRTKLEAIAVEMENQDMEWLIGAKKAISTAIYQAFNFQIISAVRASGFVTFTANPAPTADITILAGTRVATPATAVTAEKVYQTIGNATLAAGETTVVVPILCTTSGTIGNTGSLSITNMKTTVSGITSMTNEIALTNGRDTETEPDRRIRFYRYISTLTRGTNAALIYAASSVNIKDGNDNIIERVIQAGVAGPPETGSAGECDVIVFNGREDSATADLVAAVQMAIDGNPATGIAGYKAAGVIVTVRAATTVPLNITMTIISIPGFDKPTIQTLAQNVISEYFQSFLIGKTFLVNELVERIMGLNGVYNLTMATPVGDVAVASDEVVVPGTIAVTVT